MVTRAFEDWRHSRLTDVMLRLAGLCLLAVAGEALSILARTQGGSLSVAPATLSYLLAALGFVGVTCGCGLLVLGHHIFDEVEVSERWMPRMPDRAAPTLARPAVRPAFRDSQGHDHEPVSSRLA